MDVQPEPVEAGIVRTIVEPESDPLDDEDLAAIEESEQQIIRGEDLDWQTIRAKLRRKYLGR